VLEEASSQKMRDFKSTLVVADSDYDKLIKDSQVVKDLRNIAINVF